MSSHNCQSFLIYCLIYTIIGE